jgi:hypothetical protein
MLIDSLIQRKDFRDQVVGFKDRVFNSMVLIASTLHEGYNTEVQRYGIMLRKSM